MSAVCVLFPLAHLVGLISVDTAHPNLRRQKIIEVRASKLKGHWEGSERERETHHLCIGQIIQDSVLLWLALAAPASARVLLGLLAQCGGSGDGGLRMDAKERTHPRGHVGRSGAHAERQ